MQTSLLGIAKKASDQKTYRFRNLYGMLNEENLRDSWRLIRKDAAYGVDRVSADDYERNLESNIRELVQRLKEKRYHAKLIRRKWIPKGESGHSERRSVLIPNTIPGFRMSHPEESFSRIGAKRRWSLFSLLLMLL